MDELPEIEFTVQNNYISHLQDWVSSKIRQYDFSARNMKK